MEAKGGTELQFDELRKRLDPSYFKKFLESKKIKLLNN